MITGSKLAFLQYGFKTSLGLMPHNKYKEVCVSSEKNLLFIEKEREVSLHLLE